MRLAAETVEMSAVPGHRLGEGPVALRCDAAMSVDGLSGGVSSVSLVRRITVNHPWIWFFAVFALVCSAFALTEVFWRVVSMIHEIAIVLF